MTAPTFSILHATYARPEKAVAAMRMWFDRAARPEAVEYIFAVNADDETRRALLGAFTERSSVRFAVGDFAGSAPAWDAAAKISRGDVLIQGQDDVEPPQDWDDCLLEWLEGANTDPNHWRTVPTVVAVKDGYRKDALLCTAICNRLRYQQQGCFLWPEYLSVFSDDEFTIRALADDADRKCMLLRTDLVFYHEHHYHNKSIPFDATYARENSAEAYALGSALFMRRNADLVARGFKTW